ncbi:16S rRNA (cytidine(1402)-2'-O)-methyltransferase [Granulicella tundricola]|uniref:Ribosomal RNA small subunit methyltransferase I n=1 Tax=Granulicella tundricola (strain ATCC BAA-1859 / DSM 23138 / MP5ACTX9) TaxID=1198114 RepID=E8WYH0_GRATM|nr:16S rRNA (cytidine(1402)-2'-O)-methyltransferase [Granulicella tundricola]ADW69876.1 Uroporphyrin-III C/tetrapyrrole (Corrin/Porphyrin) methyltransferase [Granulicella tundricola MP5ACTX9]
MALVPDAPIAPGLYLVATPIGNLEDITLRALRVLRQADRIACEDTRTTSKLLHHYAIETPTISYHLFNEQSRTAELIADLQAGAKIAIVSDAGTPGIADPGAPLVVAAVAAGIDVFPIPGPNAALSALIASGLPAESFTFHGFLPSKSGQRRSQLESLPRGPITHIFYESPHRILETLADISSIFTPSQPVVLARELTKLHEEFLRLPVSEALASLAARPQVRGEFVLLLHLPIAVGTAEVRPQTIAQAVKALMKLESIPEMDALKRVARDRGIGKSEAYREFQRETSRPRK